MAKAKKGIYCLEIGEWYASLKDRCSVEPVLQLLHQSPKCVPYIHRDISTFPELEFYLKKWTLGKHRDYPILYLAFHGSSGAIHLYKSNGQRDTVTTDDLFQLLEGKCHRRIIHFGACSVLDMHGHKINNYLRKSGAVAISGYKKDVDWMHSSIYDLLYFSELQENTFFIPGVAAVKKRMTKYAQGMGSDMNFNIRIRRR